MWKILGLLLIHIILTRGRQITCYDCRSEEWDINEGCEIPNNATSTVICRMACQTLYMKGSTYLERGCVRHITDPDVLDDQFCYDDRCNNDIIWEKINVDNKNHYGGLNKSCFRCLSTRKNPDPSCERIGNNTKRNNRCDRKRCIVFHKDDTKEIKRDCYAWSKLSKYINQIPGEGWTIDWCDTEDCNDEMMSEYPGCRGAYFDTSKTDPDWGCISSDKGVGTVHTTTGAPTGETDVKETGPPETVRIPIVCATKSPALNVSLALLCISISFLWLN
ncbi:hypothetical protein L9F63_024295 [Diploptera punctata]|uniref:Uncharacterized protein n=1 Tax=Diploptera punctata TaxID=6984 RepID=A0AAD8E8E7_DIPPU|nr:hypothetical protein L9F63_024295 [Diploptera punctata]